MSRYDSQTLYELLPAVYRQRDAERGHPLLDLIKILAEQTQVLEDDMERLYRNWFIETCDDWVVPYIGDLLDVRSTSAKQLSTRAEVANTIGYRRRKGTLAVVEQLARDITGWPAHAVEYFTLLSTTQNLNHLRLDNHGTPDLRDSVALSRLGGPFERTAHLLEVRHIKHDAGRYNIPNIGVHVWRLSANEHRRAMAHEVDDGTGLHYTFSPLGNDMPLFNLPLDIGRPFDGATERHVPHPIQRRVLHEHLQDFYGDQSGIAIWNGQDFIEPEEVAVCNLTDWEHTVSPDRRCAIDPELGRISFASEPTSDVRVLYHYGFSANIGGGSYNRFGVDEGTEEEKFLVGADPAEEVPNSVERFATIEGALAEWSRRIEEQLPGPSIIEIDDNSTYSETLPNIELREQTSLTIRAANRKRPTLLLENEWHIVGGTDSTVELNGLLVANQGVRVTGALGTLGIKHCTFVPGRSFNELGAPLDAGAPSLRIEATTPEVTIENSIIGAIRTAGETQVKIHDSIVDAGDTLNPAYQGLEDGETGGLAEFQRTTVIGTVQVTAIPHASDTIFLGEVQAMQRQLGCLRFSYVPLGSVVPRRFHCQPRVPERASSEELERLALSLRPRFTSLLYGDPGYCQLTHHTSVQIRRGAEDESEMGAFSSLKHAQREDSLRIRLNEYLRLGMEAGILDVK